MDVEEVRYLIYRAEGDSFYRGKRDDGRDRWTLRAESALYFRDRTLAQRMARGLAGTVVLSNADVYSKLNKTVKAFFYEEGDINVE